eukprot:995644-Rhodomonas_salina.2
MQEPAQQDAKTTCVGGATSEMGGDVEFESFASSVLACALLSPSAMSNAWLNKKCEVEKSFTRGQLWNYSGHVCTVLVQECGVKRGDRVMIVYPFGIDWIVGFLACCRIGAVVVSVYPPNPNRLAIDIPKFAHFVQDSQSTIALTTRAYHAVVRGSSLVRKWPTGLKWIATDNCPEGMGAVKPALAPFDVPVQLSEPALIQYTSGSTSDPKGVVLSHGNLSHQMQIQRALVDPEARVSYVGWAPQVP